jgi:putative ABC transport system permease protein
MTQLVRDARFGLRLLWRNPGFTTVALLALALGIGANTAIFSVVHATLLAPLPFHDPEQLVIVWSKIQATGTSRSSGSRGRAHRGDKAPTGRTERSRPISRRSGPGRVR